MIIRIANYPKRNDWHLVESIARMTSNLPEKDTPPSDSWKRRILMARHSPIRELRFGIMLYDIPTWVATHLVRHVHAQPYVSSQRNDRQDKYDRNAARQDAPVNMYWTMNAEELMIVANKRLCEKASEETREVVKEICRQVVELCPEFSGVLVPMCVYHGGVCHEMKPCNKEARTC
jgi:thymidylate synthase ThyX